MRICSLVPSATEILYALGAGDDIVAVSHECDYPPDAQRKPKAIRTVIDQERSSSRKIDDVVHRSVERGESLYRLDEALLRRLRPDLVVTQALCDVCAVGSDHVVRVIKSLEPSPQVVSLHPHTLSELFQEIHVLGEVTARSGEAKRVVNACTVRLERLRGHLNSAAPRPRVLCLEWLDPPMVAGHWVPEIVELAGGLDVLGRAGERSRYVTAEEILAAQPEVLILMPCGFSMARTRQELSVVTSQSWWAQLPAVRNDRIYLVDGPAYFNRSGPRLIEGLELLAALCHPVLCGDLLPSGASEPLRRL